MAGGVYTPHRGHIATKVIHNGESSASGLSGRQSKPPDRGLAYCSVKKVSRTLPFSPIRQTKRLGLSVFSRCR